MKKLILQIMVLAMLLLTHSLWAEDGNYAIDTVVQLKQIVVSANKVLVNKNSIPLSVSVIERAEIEASSESALLPVLSQRVPGLFVTRKGVTGFGVNTNSAGTVNIRGVGGGNKVLMLFDGQPQWAGVFGHSLPDTYVASDVERVEVIRGPASLLYGSNAMGGVVNIITRNSHDDGRSSQVRVMYGSHNTQKYLVNNGFNQGKFSSVLSLNHDRSDGLRNNSDFHITNAFANLGYQINQNFKAKANASVANYFNQNPGPIANPITDNTMDVTRGTAAVSLANNHQKSSGALQIFYNWGHHEINDGYRPPATPRTFRFNSDDHNTGILLYQTFRLFQGNSFTAGIDYKNWGGHAWNDTLQGKKGEIIDRNVNEIAAYLVAQQDVFDKISLNAGLRYEHNNAYGNHWTPQLGVTLRTFEGNTLKASFSDGFRSPNIRELYISYPPYSIANPNLKPETMQNYEVAVSQYLADNQLFIELTAFYLEAKNLIAGVQGTLANINKLYNKGFEAEISYHPIKNLNLNANYSHLNTSTPVEAAPKNKFFLEGTYNFKQITLSANVESVGGLIKASGATDEQVNYTLLNAKAAYLIGSKNKGVNIFVKGENLTNTKYQILNDFPMPNTTVMAGIDVNF